MKTKEQITDTLIRIKMAESYYLDEFDKLKKEEGTLHLPQKGFLNSASVCDDVRRTLEWVLEEKVDEFVL